MSLQDRLSEIWTIAKKELVHCTRDAHVIIYSLILPIVFYPLIIIGVSEFTLWREGLTEKKPIKICIVKENRKDLPYLIKAIKKYKKIVQVESKRPFKDLREKKLDCVVKLEPDLTGMIAYLNPSSDRQLETKVFITSVASHAKSKATAQALKSSGLPKNMLKVYSLKMKSLAELKEIKKPDKAFNKYAMIKSLVMGVICVYTLIIIQSGTVYPALTAFTLEIEKKTILTSQLIPIEPWCLILGKFASVLVVSFTTAIVNISSLVFVAVYFLVKMPWSSEMISRTLKNTAASDVLAAVVVFALAVILLSSTYCFVGSIAKSFKEAQNMSSLILVSTMLLPALALIPGMVLNSLTVLIPLSNLVLAAKGVVTEEFSPGLVLIAIAINTGLSVLLLYFAKLSYYNDKPFFLELRRSHANEGN